MKKTVYLLAVIIISTLSLSAQKKVRMNVRMGNADYRNKLYNSASANYLKALKENAASGEASFNLGNAYYRLGKWDEALKQYEHNLSTQNKDKQKQSAAFANMGNTFLKKSSKKPDTQSPDQNNDNKQQQNQSDPLAQSIDAYKQALRLNPDDDEVRYNLAVAQKIQQDRQNNKKNNKNKNDKNKDKKNNKDKNKQDKNKNDQNKNKNDKNKDQNKNNQNKNDQNKNQQNQMSQENMQQILNELQQDEKATQQKVQQIKAQQQKQKNNQNRNNDMDW